MSTHRWQRHVIYGFIKVTVEFIHIINVLLIFNLNYKTQYFIIRLLSMDIVLREQLKNVLLLTVHLVNLLGWMGKGDHSRYLATLLLKIRVN